MATLISAPVPPSLSLICNPTSTSFRNSVSLPRPTSFPKIGGLTIKCVRVGGVEIPNNKRIEYSLRYIHGIGRTLSKEILNDLEMENKITKDLTDEEVIALRQEVTNYMIEGDLRRFNALNIKRLKEIRCYRGIRHMKGLPCRGQRTKNNCRTLKGRRVAVPGKKKS